MSDRLNRRELLGRIGAGAAVLALAGCPGDDETPTPTEPTPEGTAAEPETDEGPETDAPDERADRVVDVQEAGADPSGETSILPVLESVPTENVVLEFPPGEYFMDDGWRVRHFENLWIEGPEATIRPGPDVQGPLFGMGSEAGMTGLTITGLTFDVRGSNRGPRPIHGMVADGLTIEDVDVRGRMDLDQDCMRFDVLDPDGAGVVRRLSMPDGGTTAHLVTGLYVGESHRGHLTIDSCHIAGFSDNGIYASPARGRVDVVGGRYENNGISNVRVSGPATVRNVTVRCDRDDRALRNMRGIRLREGTNVEVVNCEVEMAAVTGSDGAITCAEHLEEATIRDTSVTVGADNVAALLAKRPVGSYDPDRENPLQIRNLDVTGTASNGATISIVGRENPFLEDVTVCQPGRSRDGLHLIDAGRTILRGSRVSVAGDPLINRRAQVDNDGSTLQRIDGNGDC